MVERSAQNDILPPNSAHAPSFSSPPLNFVWQIRGRQLQVGFRPLVMGIVNVTPDSFSDGGQYFSTDEAIAHGLRLVEQGADLLDIGGESTRPGSQPITLDEELRRVTPVIEGLAARVAVPLSVDTSKAEVARACLEAGAHIVNDVTALTGDPKMTEVARTSGAGVILMHMRGTPATMQLDPHYEDVVVEVGAYLQSRLDDLTKQGLALERLAIDPGIGFGKSREHNLELIARLEELQYLERPLCLGVSRKGFLGRLLDRPVEQRLAGSLAAACYAMTRHAVQILRVHDIQETRDAVTVISVLTQQARGLDD